MPMRNNTDFDVCSRNFCIFDSMANYSGQIYYKVNVQEKWYSFEFAMCMHGFHCIGRRWDELAEI